MAWHQTVYRGLSILETGILYKVTILTIIAMVNIEPKYIDMILS